MMKIQKRGLILLLILTLILSMFIASQTIPAYGANYGRLVIDDVDVRSLNQGDSVPVTISVKDNPGLTTICFRVTYDAQVLTLNKVENGTLLKGQTNSETLDANPYFCGWINSLQKVDCTNDGILVTLYFTIKDKGKASKTAIAVDKASLEAYSADLDSRNFVISGGTIILADKSEQEPGASQGGTTPPPVSPGTDIGSVDTPKPPATNPSEEEISEEAEKAALIKTVKKTKISLKSKITTLKMKKAIRLTWKTDTKLEFDGYQVYRSVKKNSKYGKKPFYTTSKTQYYNTKLKKGVRYYYKVRAYKVIDGKRYYTSYSNKTWRRVK